MATHESFVPASCTTALFLALLLHTAFARTCNSGEFHAGKTCLPCPKGTFQSNDTTGKFICTKCPANTYTTTVAVISKKLCIRCPLNAFSSPGSTKCTRCPLGKVRMCGKCVRCPPSTCVSEYLCKCKKCDRSSYSRKANSQSCNGSCGDGYGSNAKRTGCVRKYCPDGSYYDGYECMPCQYNTFRNGSMILCKECPFNTVSNNLIGPNPRCIQCPPGQLMTDYLPQTQTPESVPLCEPCPDKSTTTNGFGKPFCRKKGTPCPVNTIEDHEGDCIVCAKGERADVERKRCIPCPRKSTSLGGASPICSPCPAKAYRSKGQGGYCVCPLGYGEVHGKCEQCPAGTFGVRYSACLDCPSGWFSGRGDKKCRKCPAGTTSTKDGSATCKKVFKCPPQFIPGRLVPEIRFTTSLCVSRSTGCPPGLYPIVVRGKDHCAPRMSSTPVCPGEEVFNGVDKCIRCDYIDYMSMVKGQLRCKNCPKNSLRSSINMFSCTKCGKGFYLDIYECICRWNRFINAKGECVPCPSGHKSVGMNAVTCEKCTNGLTPSRSCDECVCDLPRVINSKGKCVRFKNVFGMRE